MKLGMKVVGLVPRKEENQQEDDDSSSSGSSSSNSDEDDSSSSSDDDSSSNDSSSDSSTTTDEDEEQENRPKRMPKAKPTKRNFRQLLPFSLRRQQHKQTVLSEKHLAESNLKGPEKAKVESNADPFGDIEISMSQMTNTPDKLLAGPRLTSASELPVPLSPHAEDEQEVKNFEQPSPVEEASDEINAVQPPPLSTKSLHETSNIQTTMEAKRRRLPITSLPKRAPVVHSRRLPLPNLPPPTPKDEIVAGMNTLKVSALPVQAKAPVAQLTSRSRHPPKPTRTPNIGNLQDQKKERAPKPKLMERKEVPKWKRVEEHTNNEEVEEEHSEIGEIARNRSIPRLIHVNENVSFESSLAPLRKLSREHNKRVFGKPLKGKQGNRNGPRVRSMVAVDVDSIQAASQQPFTVGGLPPKRTLALPTPGGPDPLKSPEWDGGQISPGPVITGGFSFDKASPSPVPIKENIPMEEKDNAGNDNDEEQENNVPNVCTEMRPMAIGSKGETYDKPLISEKNSLLKPRSRLWNLPLGMKNRWSNKGGKSRAAVIKTDGKSLRLSSAAAQKTPEPIETKFSSPKRKASASLDLEATLVQNKSPRTDNCTNLASVHLKAGGLCGHEVDGVVKEDDPSSHENTLTENGLSSVTGMRKFDSLFNSDDEASAQASTSAKSHKSAKTHVTTKTSATVKSQKTHVDQIEVEMNRGRPPFAALKRLFRRGTHPVKVSIASVPKTEEIVNEVVDQPTSLMSPIGEKPLQNDSDIDQQTSTRTAPLSARAGLCLINVQSTEETGLKDTTRALDEPAPLNDLGEAIEKSVFVDSKKPNEVHDSDIAPDQLEDNALTKQANKQHGGSKDEIKLGRASLHPTMQATERQIILQKQSTEPVLATTLGDLFGMMFQTKKDTPEQPNIHEEKKSDGYIFNVCGPTSIDVVEDQGIEVDDHNTITATSPTSKCQPAREQSLAELADDISLASKSVKVNLVKPVPSKQAKKKTVKGHGMKKKTPKSSKKQVPVQVDIEHVDLSPEPKEIEKKPTKDDIAPASTSSRKQEVSPAPERIANTPTFHISNYFTAFGSSKKTQEQDDAIKTAESEGLEVVQEDKKIEGETPRDSSVKRHDRLEYIFSAGDDNDSMANTWAEIADASLIVERAMDRIHTFGSDVTDTSQKVQDLLSLESLDTMGDDVEQALLVLRKHANRLGVRESELLLAVKSDGYESKDEDESVRTLTFGEELMEAFNLYMNRPKPRKGRTKMSAQK